MEKTMEKTHEMWSMRSVLLGFGIVLCTAISRCERLRDPCLTVKESTSLGKELFTGDVQRAQAFTFEHVTFFNCHRMPSHHLTNRCV
jgi:hypothetical protein